MRTRLGASVALALALLAPTRARAVCQGYEYQLGVKLLLAWPEQRLHVVHLAGSYGQVGEMSRWFFLDPELRRLAEISILPVHAPDDEVSVELDAAGRSALGAARADAVQAALRSAALVSPPVSGRTEAFDDALAAALVARGARALPGSRDCLRRLAPCAGMVTGRSWSCEVRQEESGWNWNLGRQSHGCFTDGERAILSTAAYAITGSDCDTIDAWVHHLPPLDRRDCPECRTGFTPDRHPTRVPVLGIAAGRAPVFEPLGFGSDGRLYFRFPAPGAPGGSALGSYDPATEALRTRGVAAPRTLRRIRDRDRVPLGGSFVRAGVRYALLPGGPLDARSTEPSSHPPEEVRCEPGRRRSSPGARARSPSPRSARSTTSSTRAALPSGTSS